jgi:hypothetical protein
MNVNFNNIKLNIFKAVNSITCIEERIEERKINRNAAINLAE